MPCNSFADFLNAEGVFSLTGERRYDWADEDARIHRSTTGVFKADVGFEHHAAVEVSWFGARDFCRWRGRWLPSEAEWRRRREARTSAHIPWAGSRPRRNAPSSVTATTRPRVGTPPCRPQPPRVEDLPGNLRQWTSSILRPYPVPARERPRRPCRSGARGPAWGQPRRSDRLVVHQHASLVRPARRRRGPPRRRVSLRDLGRPGGDRPLSKGVAAREANAAAGSTLPTGCA